MSKMIQIRNVPDELHRALKVRAVESGATLSDYLLAEIREVALKPTLKKWLDRIGEQEPVILSESPAEIIRRDRDSH